MASEAYADYHGSSSRRWPRAYSEVITHGCPRCHAKPLELCTNQLRLRNPHQAKVPCLARFKQKAADAA